MKKAALITILSIFLFSCEEDIQISSPALQAKKDNMFWRSKQTTVSVNSLGQLEITAINGYDEIVMKTAQNSVGTYLFGTTNTDNFVTYTLDKTQTEDNIDEVYDSRDVLGPVNSVSNPLSNGLDYINESIVQTTTSGTGSGLRLKVTTNSNGSVSTVEIVARGVGYKSGDIVYLVGGNNNAAVQVVNVQQSNGKIVIEKIENGFYTGSFNFNVVNDEGEIITFSEGIFYRVPLTSF
ncbi:DUF6252 domain-containing protein [Flavobacterium cucumis]|uniref:Lipoprotein n=1 Tax=Flavobacterium cucumis TaxID=416016 RepID=A0A1M7ZTC9_9FLAO|nr:DUF6252 family protein [Flavobacterium cucumis]SHO72169.1 hypothetical protein SAMN05443547_0496 [Flavobacterium cucumis]